MALDAAGLAVEQLHAGFLLIVQCRLVALQVTIDRRIVVDHRALKRSNGLPGIAYDRPFGTEHLVEAFAILRNKRQAGLHHVVFAVSGHRTLGCRRCLFLERRRRTGPEQLAEIRAVDDGLAVAPVDRAGVAARQAVAEPPALVWLVARDAGCRGIAAEPRIPEQHLAELDLGVGLRVVGGDRRIAQRRQRWDILRCCRHHSACYAKRGASNENGEFFHLHHLCLHISSSGCANLRSPDTRLESLPSRRVPHCSGHHRKALRGRQPDPAAPRRSD